MDWHHIQLPAETVSTSTNTLQQLNVCASQSQPEWAPCCLALASIHDEIMLEVREDKVAECAALLRAIMVNSAAE